MQQDDDDDDDTRNGSGLLEAVLPGRSSRGDLARICEAFAALLEAYGGVPTDVLAPLRRLATVLALPPGWADHPSTETMLERVASAALIKLLCTQVVLMRRWVTGRLFSDSEGPTFAPLHHSLVLVTSESAKRQWHIAIGDLADTLRTGCRLHDTVLPQVRRKFDALERRKNVPP